MGEDKGASILELLASDLPEPRTLELICEIKDRHIARSLAFNHDKNPVHEESIEAKRFLLSLASYGGLGAEELEDCTPERRFDVVADMVRGLNSIRIAPGIWLSSLFDRYFTFPGESFPPDIPGFGENPSLKLGCRIAYANSEYKYPLAVPVEGFKDIKVVFIVSNNEEAKAEGLNAKRITFKIYTKNLFGKEELVQATVLDVFPAETNPQAIADFYSSGTRKLTEVEVIYNKEGPAVVDGIPCINTTTHPTFVSGEDYGNYGVSIGKEDLGDKCDIISPLALQTKIPRVLFKAITELSRSSEYLARAKKVSERARMKESEKERRKAIEKYISVHPASDWTVDKVADLQQRVYVSQETFFVPAEEVRLADRFNVSVSLTKYKPGTGKHVFISEAKREEGFWGTSGRRIMVGRTEIVSSPLVTKTKAEYLKHFRLTMDLKQF